MTGGATLHLVLSLTAAATLLVAALLGARRCGQPAVGITVAAGCAGVAALLSSVPAFYPADPVSVTAALVVAVGLAGSGLFTTAAALSRRLRAMSPLAVGGTVLMVQVLLIVDGALASVSRPAAGHHSQLLLLVLLTALWPLVGAGVLVAIGRRVLRYIGSRPMRAVLRIAALLLGLLTVALIGLAALQLTPASLPGRAHLVMIGDIVVFACASLLGLCLIGTRSRRRLRPWAESMTAALLFWRLGRLEVLLVGAMPRWQRGEAIARPSLWHEQPANALYARMVVIWDTTRALLSSVPPEVVSEAVDLAHRHSSTTSTVGRAALAEATWLGWALRDPHASTPVAFQVLDQEQPPGAGELLAEARFQLRISGLLHRRSAPSRQILRQLDHAAESPGRA
ncbi:MULTISPECIES: DUF6545 domain-containing protein [unclassified Pseudonocardia]|uniref:DUF6545 domain-containing protein n=1 Tax=unclassified Pseudonocardia TaxID=2619320 RepID=UPI0001FFDA64|nr:DUF6545 domain-containing protein [Pseudonocardia sp. Ae707_Ps1]OLM09079.1 hypothetical protein Ae707Ps1_6026 [Pseudonocardia sp. Ae707_Ps1]